LIDQFINKNTKNYSPSKLANLKIIDDF